MRPSSSAKRSAEIDRSIANSTRTLPTGGLAVHRERLLAAALLHYGRPRISRLAIEQRADLAAQRAAGSHYLVDAGPPDSAAQQIQVGWTQRQQLADLRRSVVVDHHDRAQHVHRGASSR